MARIGVPAHHGGPATLNDPESEYQRTCIGDRCAMWRWAPSTDFKPETEVRPAGPFGTEKRIVNVLNRLPPVLGYCGIAGRPEVAS